MPHYVIFSFLGLAVGSFLNVCIDRLPAGESIVRHPSHCTSCGHLLTPLDLVPVLSYLWLRGRCHYCRAVIPLRILLVELASGTMFGLLTWHYGLGTQQAVALVYASVLLVVFVIDLEQQLVLDVVIYPTMLFALGASLVWPDLSPPWALAGGALGMAVLGLPFLMYREGMGMGDVKLAALIGVMTGFPLVVVSLLLAIVAGGLVAAILLGLRIKGRKDAIAFGPFLAAAAMVTVVWGQSIWDWYPAWG